MLLPCPIHLIEFTTRIFVMLDDFTGQCFMANTLIYDLLCGMGEAGMTNIVKAALPDVHIAVPLPSVLLRSRDSLEMLSI